MATVPKGATGLLIIAVFAAACGGSAQTGAAAYSHCMRTHGVPHFPRPNAKGHFLFAGSSGINPGAPAFQSAQRGCQHFLWGKVPG